MKDKKWDDLSKVEKKILIDWADSLYIPANFVPDMYDAGELNFFEDDV